jgi:hypothetical protein
MTLSAKPLYLNFKFNYESSRPAAMIIIGRRPYFHSDLRAIKRMQVQ